MSSVPALAASIAAAAESTELAASNASTESTTTDHAVPIGATPSTTTAAVRYRYGAPVEAAAVKLAAPADDQVLIEVRAAGIDRGTHHVHTGTPYIMRLMGFGLTKPNQPILGMDISGVVTAVGAGVTRFSPGDEVFGVGTGTFARTALADESKLSHKPLNLSHTHAGALPISGATALQAVRDHGRVEAGQHVLVLGASGGVGSYAVQLAKVFGAEVTGVASGPKLAMVRSLGADHVIDYTTADALDGSTRYDLIIDTGGRRPLSHVRQALTDSGTLVIVGGEGGNRITGGIGRQLRAAATSPFVSQTLKFFIAAEGRESTDTLADLASTGAIKPMVNHHYRLDQVQVALDDLAAGRISGKAVIEMDQENEQNQVGHLGHEEGTIK